LLRPKKTREATLSALRRFSLSERVEFFVVGGQAEWLFGGALPTFDVDLCYRRTRENLKRLAKALGRLKPSLRNAPPDLPFHIDEQSLAATSISSGPDVDLRV
jgi:hypothetical protein